MANTRTGPPSIQHTRSVPELKDKVHETTEAAKRRITDAKFQTLHTADQTRDKAEQAIDKAEQSAARIESSIPPPVAAQGRRAADVARRPVIPVAVAAVAGIAVWLFLRRRRS
ncbi:hypothetical protein [Nocardia sp. MW-W600-9]